MDIKKEDSKNNQIEKDLTNQGLNDDGGSEIDYKELVRAILRKKKWAIIAGSLTFFSILGYSINQRFTNPVYSGSFRLLIRDGMVSLSGLNILFNQFKVKSGSKG